MKLSGSAMGTAVSGEKKKDDEVSSTQKIVELEEFKGGRGNSGCRRKVVIEASEARPIDEGA